MMSRTISNRASGTTGTISKKLMPQFSSAANDTEQITSGIQGFLKGFDLPSTPNLNSFTLVRSQNDSKPMDAFLCKHGNAKC